MGQSIFQTIPEQNYEGSCSNMPSPALLTKNYKFYSEVPVSNDQIMKSIQNQELPKLAIKG
jgi:hypothetical protein